MEVVNESAGSFVLQIYSLPCEFKSWTELLMINQIVLSREIHGLLSSTSLLLGET